MGRPKLDDARDRSYKVRVNEEEERMLQFIVDHTGQKKADVFRRSLKELYNSVRMHNYETKNGPDDLYEGLDGIDLKRIVACPHCGSDNKIDLTDECTSTSHERSMGDEIIYEFDTEAFKCEKCGRPFRVYGYISEYPLGAFNSEDIKTGEAE